MSFFEVVIVLFAVFAVYLLIKRKIMLSSVKNYTADEVKEKIKNDKNIILLDVRTLPERNSRKINGSLHIPLGELNSRLSELDKHKNKEIIVYCASGSRSLSAVSLLTKNNFNAVNMRGGIYSW